MCRVGNSFDFFFYYRSWGTLDNIFLDYKCRIWKSRRINKNKKLTTRRKINDLNTTENNRKTQIRTTLERNKNFILPKKGRYILGSVSKIPVSLLKFIRSVKWKTGNIVAINV